MEFAGERKMFAEHMKRTGGKFAEHFNSGSCHICGARASYIAKFHHVPSNTYISTGMDCAGKMDMGDARLFADFRKRVRAGLEVAAGKAKAQRILTDAGLNTAWDVYAKGEADAVAKGWDSLPYEEKTILDIIRKLIKYGSISGGQTSFIVTLLAKIDGRAAIAAKRAAEMADAAPVPVTAERVEITGTVLSTRTEESPYGTVTKMLVQHTAGYKLWGTAPNIILAADGSSIKGSTVSFSARVQRSDKDEKFGFFSRPTKARIVRSAAASEVPNVPAHA